MRHSWFSILRAGVAYEFKNLKMFPLQGWSFEIKGMFYRNFQKLDSKKDRNYASLEYLNPFIGLCKKEKKRVPAQYINTIFFQEFKSLKYIR